MYQTYIKHPIHHVSYVCCIKCIITIKTELKQKDYSHKKTSYSYLCFMFIYILIVTFKIVKTVGPGL